MAERQRRLHISRMLQSSWLRPLILLGLIARAMEAGRLQIFRMVRFPHAMPAIFAGLKVSITLAVVGAVVGEFVGSNNGIGFVLQRPIGNFELPTMFAALIVLSLLGIILFWLLDVMEQVAIPWPASQGNDLIVEPDQQ